MSPVLDQINGNNVSYDYGRGTHHSYDVNGNVNTMLQEFTSLERLGYPALLHSVYQSGAPTAIHFKCQFLL